MYSGEFRGRGEWKPFARLGMVKFSEKASQNSKAYGDWIERQIQHKDELTWPAFMLTFITCLSNGTSLLAAPCPCKNQAGWPF